MNVACTSESCPIVLNSKCVFYEGAALSNIAVSTNDSIQTVVQKVNDAFDDIINNFSAVWGNIGGTVEDQVDLIAYLDANYAPISAGGYWPLAGTAPSTGEVVINGAHKKTISVNSALALYGGLEATDGGGAIWGGSGATDYATAVRGIQVTSTGINIKGSPANYATDLSGSFTARSLVDKGYVDSVIASGAFWPLAGQGVLTSSVNIYPLAANDNLFDITIGADEAESEGFARTVALYGRDSYIIGLVASGATGTSLRIGGVTTTFTDSRATQLGIQYAADYSTTFTDRSLADWGNVWKGKGNSTLSANVDIIQNAANNLNIGVGENVSKTRIGASLAVLGTGTDAGSKVLLAHYDSSNTNRVEVAGYGVFIHVNDGDIDLKAEIAKADKFRLRLDAIGDTAIFTDSRVSPKGLEYFADYSATFSSRSLIDKGYADTKWPLEGIGILTDPLTMSGGGFDMAFTNFSALEWTAIVGVQFSTIIQDGTLGDLSLSTSNAITVTTGDGEGVKYTANYAASFTNRSLVDKEYVDGLVGTGNFWPLDDNASLLTDVTLTQDGFEVRFAGTNANTDVFLDPSNNIRIRVGIDTVGFQYTGLTTEGVVSEKTGTGQLFSFTGDGLNWSSGVANIEFTQQAAGYFTFNNKAYFTSENNSAPINIGGYAGDVVGSTDGDIWYNSTLGRFRIQQGSTIKNMVDPFAIVEDVTTTTYTFTEADHGKIKRFTHASGCLATVPIGLSLGWTTTAYRASGAGLLTFASDGVLESAGTTLDSEKTAATLFNRGTNIHVAVGAFGTGGGGGGITNTAGANEMMKSDGTNAVSSGLFSNSLGLLEIRNGTKMALKIGADNGATTLTDSTVKWGGFSVPHYTNSEEPFQVIWGDANVSSNTVFIGGNNALANAATSIQFWLGVNNNTITGNLEATLNSTGFHIGRNATTGRKLSVVEETATTNAVTNIARFTSRSTGTPAVGIGAGIEFQTETASGNDELTGAIESVVTNTAGGNEYADLVLKNFSQGAQLEALRLVSTTGYSRMTTTYANGFEISSVLQVSAQTRINNTMKVGIIGDSTIDRRLHVEENGTSTNDTLYAVRLTRICSSGNALANIGVGIEFETENGVGANVVGATFEAIATDVTSASEDYAFVWKLMAGGAAPVERMRLTSSGSGGLLTMNNLSTGGVTSLYAGEIQLDNIISGDDLTINYNGITSTGVATFEIDISGELFLDPTSLRVDISAIPTSDPGISGRIYRSGGALQISL